MSPTASLSAGEPEFLYSLRLGPLLASASVDFNESVDIVDGDEF